MDNSIDHPKYGKLTPKDVSELFSDKKFFIEYNKNVLSKSLFHNSKPPKESTTSFGYFEPSEESRIIYVKGKPDWIKHPTLPCWSPC
jgi:hypothetical protein